MPKLATESAVSAAFSNPVVTDVLAQYLSLKDLKSCRLVSASWSWVTPHLRKVSKVRLRKLEDFYKIINHPSPHYYIFPFKQVVLCIPHPAWKFPAIVHALDLLWTTHGPTLTYLRLQNVPTCDISIIKDILCRQTPNVKTLVLQNCFHGVDEKDLTQLVAYAGAQVNLRRLELTDADRMFNANRKVQLLKILLRMYPNIQALRLQDYFCWWDLYSCYYYLWKVFSSLAKTCSKNKLKYSLKSLEIVDGHSQPKAMPSHFVRVIKSLDFPLEVLILPIGNYTREENISRLLSLYKATLRRLEITRPSSAPPFPKFSFGTELTALKFLRMPDCIFLSLSFLKYTPNLESLQIYYQRDHTSPENISGVWDFLFPNRPNIVERTKQREMEGVEVTRLREFHFTYFIMWRETREKIRKWMPGAKVRRIKQKYRVW